MNGRELADRLGISQAMVSRLRSGERKPSFALMRNIRSVTGWTISSQIDALEAGVYPQKLSELLSPQEENNEQPDPLGAVPR